MTNHPEKEEPQSNGTLVNRRVCIACEKLRSQWPVHAILTSATIVGDAVPLVIYGAVYARVVTGL